MLDAECMVEAFGYEGRARYDEAMVEVARSGGRGLVQAADVDWYLDDAARRVFQTVESVIWTAGSSLALVFDASLRVTGPIDCPRCGKRVVEWIGQLLRQNELTYYCSHRCPNCGGTNTELGGQTSLTWETSQGKTELASGSSAYLRIDVVPALVHQVQQAIIAFVLDEWRHGNRVTGVQSLSINSSQ